MKIINYDVDIKSTKINGTLATPRVYTNDLNSVVFQFNVLDMTTGELTGATATTLLYMRDGSFFQNASTDVDLVGNVFSYTLKENEGNHGGLAQIQLVVKIGTKEYATQLYNFEIVSGLETKVATEVMIQDWTTLTREARAYIDQFVADEAVRQQQFETAEANRVTFFETAETNRVSAEQGRVTAETGRVNAESSRVSAETGRVSAEQARVDAESIRAEFYDGFDGRLDDLEADKVAIKNLVTNGDFSQGATGWEFGQLSSSMVVSDGVSKVGARYVSYSPYYPIAIDKNKKYFISSQIKDIDLVSSLMPSYALTNGNSLLNESQHLGSYFEEIDTEKFSRVSRVVTANNHYTSISMMKAMSNSSIARYAYFDDLIFVNLTDTFGAGNEPTRAEMDELIKITGYFDEITLAQKQLLNWQLKLMRQNRNALIALGGTII